MSLLQKAVILLNFWPFTAIFRAIYALGLSRLLAALKKCEAVHSIYGCGSFFEGRCLYGLSDIDLIIVVDERYDLTDDEPHAIVDAYNRVRRFFPFLGQWSEKAESVVFLSELKKGFLLPESFRLRCKRGKLHLLYGEATVEEMAQGALSINEVVVEINTLLRMSLAKGEVHTSNLLFWKRMFCKLADLAGMVGLHELARRIRQQEELSFIEGNEILLFIRKSDPDRLFGLLLRLSREIYGELLQREERVSVVHGQLEPDPRSTVAPSKELANILQVVDAGWSTLDSPLFGLTPRLNYCSMDGALEVIELERASYGELRRIVKGLRRNGEISKSFLVNADGFLIIVNRQPSYVEIVPLDPLGFANTYAQLDGRREAFDMPRTIHEEQVKAARGMFEAYALMYSKNNGTIKKLPFPCVYFENDTVFLEDALHRARVYLLHEDRLDIRDAVALIEHLARRHPTCQAFLHDLLDYYREMKGEQHGNGLANNLYRCLHQFMAQLLAGEVSISVDDHRKHLGITVGIITRDRPDDLGQVLESLILQSRPADEVLIVDNGSNGSTKQVVDSFRARLPIAYHAMEQGTIPLLRNTVIENASQDIVSFTDDDCVVEEHWLQSVERAFLRADNVGVVGGWVKHLPAEKTSVIDTYYSVFHQYKP